MSLAGAGLGGMSIAEVYAARKIQRETTKKLAASAAGEKDNLGGGLREAMKPPPARRTGRWCFGKATPKKSSAKVLDLMAAE